MSEPDGTADIGSLIVRSSKVTEFADPVAVNTRSVGDAFWATVVEATPAPLTVTSEVIVSVVPVLSV